MSASAFRRLRAALVAHLCAADSLAGVPVHENRARPIGQDEACAINVRTPDSSGTQAVIEATDWRTTVAIDCLAGTDVGGVLLPPEAADHRADQLLAAVWAALHGFAATPAAKACGVLDIDDEPVIAWDSAAEDLPYACAGLRITVVHRTPATSLQPWT